MLADPRDAGLGALGHRRQLHRVTGDEDGVGHAVGALHLHDHVALGHVLVGDDLRRRVHGPGGDAHVAEQVGGLQPGLVGQPGLDGGPDVALQVLGPAEALGEAGSSTHSGRPIRVTRAANWCSRTTCMLRYPSLVAKASRIIGSGASGCWPRDQRLDTTSVMATTASSMAMSTYWPTPVRSRWRRAARIPMTPNRALLMSPRAPTGLGRGGSPGAGPRRRCRTWPRRSRRTPAIPGRGCRPGSRSRTPTRRSRRGARRGRPRSRGRGGPSSPP